MLHNEKNAPPTEVNNEVPPSLTEIGLMVANKVDAMLAYWDANQVCRFANDSYKKWFRKTSAEMIDKLTMLDLMGNTLYKKNLPYIEAALAGKTQTFERELLTANNEVRYTLATYYPDVLNGHVRGFIAHVVDVTPMKKLEMALEDNVESLRQSDERYQKMVAEVADSALLLTDTEGNIENWNKGAAIITGYLAHEVIGKNFRMFYTPEERAAQKFEKVLEIVMKEGRAEEEGWRMHKDGTKFRSSTTITALHGKGGRIIGFSKVIRRSDKQ